MDQPAQNGSIANEKASLTRFASLSGGQFFRFLVFSTVIILLVVVFFGFFNKNNQRINLPSAQNQQKGDKVLAIVAGEKILQSDLDAYDLIYNAEAKYQQKVSTKSAELAPNDEVLMSLIRVTKIKIAAQKEGILVSDKDMEFEVKKGGGQEKIIANIKRYNWTFDDWKKSREMVLLEEKLSEKVSEWRLGEFVSVRWDVIPKKVEGNLIGVYQDKSKKALKIVEDRFSLGDDVEKLAVFLRSDESVLLDFTNNAVQFYKVDSDPQVKFMQRVVKAEKNFDWQNHVLALGPKIQSDLWCSEFACYLTRVLDGNNSKYNNLEDYLNAEIK
jgi:hypothetical protein